MSTDYKVGDTISVKRFWPWLPRNIDGTIGFQYENGIVKEIVRDDSGEKITHYRVKFGDRWSEFIKHDSSRIRTAPINNGSDADEGNMLRD